MDMTMTPVDTALTMMQAGQKNVDAVSRDTKQARDLQSIRETAQDFEAMFMTEMMRPMFDGIKTDGPFGGGKGEEVFRGFMLTEYGKMLAGTGQIGIAQHVEAEMIRLQAAQAGKDEDPGAPSADTTDEKEITHDHAGKTEG